MTTRNAPANKSKKSKQSTAVSRRRTAVGQPRELLKDQAYRELKGLIQTGVLEPQGTVSERQLSDRLGMSKTPIRAALETLEQQGLVTVSPQKGILIRELSAREIGDLFELRTALEPHVASRLATRSLSKTQAAELQSNITRQGIAAKNEDAVAGTLLDIEFHRLLGTMLANDEISACLERCFDKLQRSVLRIHRIIPGRLEKSTTDHENIVNMILSGDADQASRAMLDHLRYGQRFLMGIDQ